MTTPPISLDTMPPPGRPAENPSSRKADPPPPMWRGKLSAADKALLPPGLPRSLPFYAFKPWVKLGDPILLFEYLKATYGEISYYSFMGTPIVFINNPDYIREVLVTQGSAFVKERTVRRMKILLGEGLITSDDPIHIRQRRIAAPAFHRQRIAAYADQIVAIAAAQRDRWQPGQTIDIAAQSMALSLEIVARTLFDTEVDADIRDINDQVNTIMELYNFIVAFPKIESFLHLPIPGITKFRRAKSRLDKVVDRLVREHREASAIALAEGRNADRGDLLSMLLSSRDIMLGADGNPTGESTGMSNEQVRDEVLTIFLAGYETVANALTWTWYLLSQNPEAAARMHAELDAVLGPGSSPGCPVSPASQKSARRAPVAAQSTQPNHNAHGPDRDANEPYQDSHRPDQDTNEPSRSLAGHRLPTLADYPNLRYTEQVFAESMRLYPPAWAMGRMATRPVTLGPYVIPAGAHVFFSQYMMSRTEQYYPDPLRFDPDRFSPEAKAARPKYAYFPFGGGSRQCIGESFAWMEGTLSLATLAQKWSLAYADPTPPKTQAKITLRPKDPLHMRLQLRTSE